jgi:hypothetical protein
MNTIRPLDSQVVSTGSVFILIRDIAGCLAERASLSFCCILENAQSTLCDDDNHRCRRLTTAASRRRHNLFYVQTAELTYHVLSAGNPSNPLILLLHGFPELAFSWRKVMLPLAAAGFHARLFHWKSFLFTSSDLQLHTKERIIPDLHEHTCRGP